MEVFKGHHRVGLVDQLSGDRFRRNPAKKAFASHGKADSSYKTSLNQLSISPGN
jgi:hypothetical protein